MTHDKRIFENWNKVTATKYLYELTRMGDREFDYHANRMLTQSWNIFGAISHSFRIANMMLSCFLGEAQRDPEEVIALLKRHYFNNHLIVLLEEVKDLKFSYTMNSDESSWINPTAKILAAEVAVHYAAKTLLSAVNEGKTESLYEVLSSERFVELRKRIIREPRTEE